MRLKRFGWALCLLAVLAVGCTDDKKKDDGGILPPPDPDPIDEMRELTPEESKIFLQSTAIKALDLFKPEDQKAIMELGTYFEEQYGDYDIAEIDLETPRSYIKVLSEVSRGNIDALAKAATSYTYTIKFDKFAGIYEPNDRRKEWVKTGISNDIIFKFKNEKNQPVELKVTQSGGASELEYSFVDWDWDYDDKGDYEEFEVQYNYFLSIPKTVNLTLTENGAELARSNVQSSIDVKGHTLSADIQSSMMNIKAVAKVNGTDSKIEATTEISVGNIKLADAYAVLNGSNLLNKEKYESFEEMNDYEIDAELVKMFNTVSGTINILDEVQVYSNGKYYSALGQDLDSEFDYYDYSKTEARNACQRACDRLNENIKTTICYNNTSTIQATMQFAPGYYERNSDEWKYYISASLLFPDKTTYEIDGYFDNFTTVSNKWDMLLSAYEKMMKQVTGRK